LEDETGQGSTENSSACSKKMVFLVISCLDKQTELLLSSWNFVGYGTGFASASFAFSAMSSAQVSGKVWTQENRDPKFLLLPGAQDKITMG